MSKINTAYIGVGTNLGNQLKNINLAYELIQLHVGVIRRKSYIYETKAWGFVSEDKFFNSVIKISTKLNSNDLLLALKNIEKSCGRKQSTNKGYSSRVIDLDILDFNREIINIPHLIVPHLHIFKRIFVIKPFFDIAPSWKHPVDGRKLSNGLVELSQTQEIKKVRN